MIVREEKHFFIQMVSDFYEDSRLQYLESMPDGMMYSFFYTRLLLKSVKTEGKLRVSEKVAYNDAMLAKVTGISADTVRPAMEILEELGLIEKQKDGTIFIVDVPKMVASESKWADYKRKQRSKADSQELSNECPIDVQSGVGQCPTETETERKTETKTKTETEREKENAPAAARSPSVKNDDLIDKNKYGSYGWVKLSNDEHAQLLDELGEAELARCIAYIDESAQSTGNRNQWRDWALVLRRCSREQWGIGKAENSAQKQQTGTIGYHPQEDEYSDYAKREDSVTDLERMRAYLAKLKRENP